MARKGENIYRRKDGRWEARYISRYENGKAKYAYIYGVSYAEARAKKAAAQACAEPNIQKAARQMVNFETLAESWLTEVKSRVKESTFTRYYRIVNKYLFPIFKKEILFKIDKNFLNGAVEKLCRGGLKQKSLSPKTVTDIICVLKSIFKFGKENGFIVPPVSEIRCPQRFASGIKILTSENRIRLEKAVTEACDPTSIGIMLALFTGIRIGELCALKWGDIDFSASVITVSMTVERIADLNPNSAAKTKIIISEPKTKNSAREIPVPGFLLDYLKARRSASNYFIITGSADFIEPHRFYMRYKSYLRQNRLDDYTFHSLRHTFATRCVELGFDIKSLSEILGHAAINTTLSVYVHPTIRQKRAQMEKLAPR